VMIVTTSLPRSSKPTQFRNQTCSSTLIVKYFSQGCQGSPRGIQVYGLSFTPTGNLGDNEDSGGDVNGHTLNLAVILNRTGAKWGWCYADLPQGARIRHWEKIQDCPRSCPKIVHL
jgi:hypothetical protein